MASYNTVDPFNSANPYLDQTSNYEIVVALDFGTTYCGYAWSLKSSKDDIQLNKPWGAEFAMVSPKTPTVILINHEKKPVAFGYQARKKFSTLKHEKLHIYDRNFKMQLYETKKLDNKVEITSSDGEQSITLLSLITMFIDYLYQHFLEELNRSYNGLDESLVRVVLTVPAIWPDHAKSFMRKAACEAGINPDQLMLALEPEAASLYCRTLQPKQLRSEKPIDVNLPKGTRYIVIDCGGGTVDISVHEVVDNDSVKEIHRANGGPWGGANVNKTFEELLEDLVGKIFIENYKRNHPLDWFYINANFEIIKRTYEIDTGTSISMPVSLIKEYEKRGFRKDITKHINKRKKEGFEVKDGRLYLSSAVAANLFKCTTSSITNHVSELWENNELIGTKYVFVVGGFSECTVLFTDIRETISELDYRVQVLKPPNADIAVLKGAVLFGHRPNKIISRISRKTYGPGVMLPFDPLKHAQHKKIIVDEEEKCTDVFQIWAKKNEPIGLGEMKMFTIYPHCTSSKSFYISIFAIDSEHVMYTTDPGVIKLASLEIPTPDTQLPKEQREVRHYVYFGGTELHVKIQDAARPDGAIQEAKITFDFDHATQL